LPADIFQNKRNKKTIGAIIAVQNPHTKSLYFDSAIINYYILKLFFYSI